MYTPKLCTLRRIICITCISVLSLLRFKDEKLQGTTLPADVCHSRLDAKASQPSTGGEGRLGPPCLGGTMVKVTSGQGTVSVEDTQVSFAAIGCLVSKVVKLGTPWMVQGGG